MQLDATLRSFLAHCAEGDLVNLNVLYHTTSTTHARQYAELIAEYRPYHHISFQPQSQFRRDVLGFLAAHGNLRHGGSLYRRLASLHRRLSFLSQPLLHFGEPRFVLFLVDDNLFVSDFRIVEALKDLVSQPQALGFSLRLGRNTAYCYTRDLPQAVPEFTPLDAGVLCFDWRRSELDFAYPLEVSSSIYRIADLLPLLNRQRFRNPNQLETSLAENAWKFKQRPDLLCYPQSVTFCNPVNQVTERYQNRFGVHHPMTSQELARKFDSGLRIDVDEYNGFIPKGCHQEVELHFYLPEAGIDGF